MPFVSKDHPNYNPDTQKIAHAHRAAKVVTLEAVLPLIAKGLSTKEIGAELGVDSRSVARLVQLALRDFLDTKQEIIANYLFTANTRLEVIIRTMMTQVMDRKDQFAADRALAAIRLQGELFGVFNNKISLSFADDPNKGLVEDEEYRAQLLAVLEEAKAIPPSIVEGIVVESEATASA